MVQLLSRGLGSGLVRSLWGDEMAGGAGGDTSRLTTVGGHVGMAEEKSDGYYTYSLERQVDGGEWEAIYSGDQLSFTDLVTRGWRSVAYQVRAFDAANAYSGFAVSETRQVNNNTPPPSSGSIPPTPIWGRKTRASSWPIHGAKKRRLRFLTPPPFL